LTALITVTTTSIILSSHKIQNGDVLVPVNPDPSGKWPLKWRERLGPKEPLGIALLVKIIYRQDAIPVTQTTVS